MNASRVHPAWVVIVAGVSVALHIGKLPPALPVLREALDISLLQAGFLLSLVQLAGMALGLAIGLGTDALGLRRSMLLGMGILCGASALGGFAQVQATARWRLWRGVGGFFRHRVVLLRRRVFPALWRRVGRRAPLIRVNANGAQPFIRHLD